MIEHVVACSTVTVTKCQAALRTLQAFPFFKPTCLCREPHVDPECNSFRDFLFDHPCVFVLKKEKDPYPVDALPTCNHALSVCQQERKCIKLFEDFKSNCKVRENKCRMDDRDLCHESWTNLRLSPMFGCICPNNHMKRRCDRIFSMVNHNPCVDILPFSFDLSGTDSALYPYDPEQGYFKNFWFPPTNLYPYFLFPSTTRPRMPGTAHASGTYAYRTHRTGSAHDNDIQVSIEETIDDSLRLPAGVPPESVQGNSDDRSGNHEFTKLVFQSTCHVALDNCNNNYSCRMALHPVLHHCDISRCNRNSCMEALQSFYRRQDLTWSLEIAFCLCKKTDNKYDPCMLAQEKLHPVCAQRLEGGPTPTCHSLAETCREDKECRSRLEYYEQSCAVDSVTKKCAGPPAECRTAMLGILGTELRTTCACKGTDLTQLYDCLGWQRLLWVNPCVVESQKNYHMNRSEQMQTTTPSTLAPTKMTTMEWKTTPSVHFQQATIITMTEATLQTRRSTTVENFSPPIPTVTTTTTTTIPPRFCVFQRPHQSNQYIREGKTKRMYHEDEVECSEICHCGMGEALVCHTICVDRKPCKSDFAFYNHAAPAYQAFRGRCLCYSGRFICMKPAPGDYSLPPGVFLFLGYSETDESLLKPHSNLSVHDAVAFLQEFLIREADNGTLCTLSLFNVTKENVILVAKLSGDLETNDVSPIMLLRREKEESL
ncbi:Glial cell line-derived neurotrophic family receptor-like [Carabus blaptoides fortunei]